MISTSTTTIESTSHSNTLAFLKDSAGVTFDGSFLRMSTGKKFKKDEPRLIDLVSDQPKVLMSLTTSLYHLYHDEFAELLTQYEITPNAKFLIDITHIKNLNPLPEYIKMIFKFLNSNGIDYRPIDLSVNNIFNINNLYYRNPDAESFAINRPTKKLYEFANKYVEDKDSVADKKVYLSRKNFKNRDLSFFIKGKLSYENDNRFDDEQLVEDYFKSLGFEIVCPEDFESFEEQMKFFYNVKKIVSVTSSGLLNSCFMRPGSTMIEITTPLISFDRIGNGVTDRGSSGQQELHHFYHTMSIIDNKKYLSIPNVERSSKSFIDTIEANIELKTFLVS